MKIAVASDDGVNTSQHFGRAPYYVVATVEDGGVVARETRVKSGHHTFAAAHMNGDYLVDARGNRGYGSVAASRHDVMAQSILDCQILICGGMGWGAYESMQSNNIKTIVTDIINLHDAIASYLSGTLTNLTDRLH